MKTFPLVEEEKKILMASGRSVVYLWVAKEQRTDKRERKIKGKLHGTEKLNYVPKYYHSRAFSISLEEQKALHIKLSLSSIMVIN